jgi:hypothetical protein
MNELELTLQHLKQPEYVHVLLNPLPLYGLGMGVLALIVALLLRSKQAQLVALILVIIGAGSAWPVIEYGERGYDRVYSMSNGDGQRWLEIHAHRAGRWEWLFYVTAAAALATIIANWKFTRAAIPLAGLTLALAIFAVGVAGWISRAGGQIRHSEFRDSPPPKPQRGE